jgi:hypothetical protein
MQQVVCDENLPGLCHASTISVFQMKVKRSVVRVLAVWHRSNEQWHVERRHKSGCINPILTAGVIVK